MRTAVIHDFIKDLIDETKLFFDIVLSDLPIAIGFADEDELVEELDGHGSVDVGLGGRQEDQIFVGHCDIGDPVQ